MNERIRNVLGVAGALAMLLAGYAAMSYSSTYSKAVEPSSFRSFSATGEAKVIAVPDIARLGFSVVTEGGKDVAKVQEENTVKMNKAVAFLKDAGIDAKDIQTQQYSLEPRYQYFDCSRPYSPGAEGPRPCPPAEIVGYTVRQGVDVKIREKNFSKIGEIVSGIVKNGANQVSSPSFTVDDPAKLRDEARAQAIAKAKESAQAIAKAGGFTIGRLLGIDDGGAQYFMREYSKVDAMGMGGQSLSAPMANAAPAIEPGSQDITVSVTLSYEIQ